jgi:transposase
MREKVRFLGLDVHAETIAVAIAEPEGEVRSLGTIPNREDSLRKMIKKLGPPDKLRVCYEAGPTGYVIYWQLAELGVKCEVIAPTLVPVKSGDRVKTDRRDAEKLARCYRAGDLTAVWVPDEGSEALRDLVRAREAAKQDQLRARHRLSKFLLRSGQRPPSGVRSWTRAYLIWVTQLRFTQMAQEATRLDYLHEVEHMRERVERLEQAITEAVKLASPALQQVINDLQALRGIADISAVTIAAELGQVSRFDSARKLMGYCGAVPSESSSGKRTRRGSITKTGNSHLRRIVVEAAWSYHRPPGIWYGLRKRQESISEEAKEIAWKAQHRLHKRYLRLAAAGKDKRKITTAVARELLGFIWAIGTRAETVVRQRIAA